MKKGIKYSIIALITLALAIAAWTMYSANSGPTGQAISSPETPLSNSINLVFSNNLSDCAINGELYVDDNELGELNNNQFSLSRKAYETIFKNDSILNLIGETSKCSSQPSLPIDISWKINDLEPFFLASQDANFNADSNQRSPTTNTAKFFIQPNDQKVNEELSTIKFEGNDTLANIEKIISHMASRVQYRKDSTAFKVEDYWQTPAETLNNHFGDCEDWSTTTLSLIKAKYPNVQAYNVILSTHLTIFVFYNGAYHIYDQSKTEVGTRLEKTDDEYTNKMVLRAWLVDYFRNYGVANTERNIQGIFDDKEYIQFNSNDDFIDWALSLQ